MYNYLYKNTFISFLMVLAIFGAIILKFSFESISLVNWHFFPLLGTQNHLAKDNWSIILFLLLIMSSFLLSILLSYSKIVNSFNLIPSLLFAIFSSFVFRIGIAPTSVFSVLFIIILHYIFAILLKKKFRPTYFFWIGISFSFFLLINYQIYVYILGLIIIIIRFESNGVKDFMAFILGFILIIYLFVSLAFFIDIPYPLFNFFNQFYKYSIQLNIVHFAPFVIIGILSWLIFVWMNNLLTVLNKNLYYCFFILLISSTLYTFLFSDDQTSAACPLIYCFSIFLSAIFWFSKNKKFKNISFIIFFIAFLVNIIL